MDTGQNQIAKYKHQQKAGLNDVAKTLSVGLKGKDLHSFTKGMESDIKEDLKVQQFGQRIKRIGEPLTTLTFLSTVDQVLLLLKLKTNVKNSHTATKETLIL